MENLRPQIGERVRVRQRTWRVQEAEEYERARVLTLAGHSADGVPCVLRVLHPADDVVSVPRVRRVRRVGMRRWQRACAALIAEHGGAAALHTAASAALDVLPFQLEPALALVGGLGSRLLVADDVGLGKTVQALLCAAELRARAIGHRVLVLCPPGLREQWATEAAAKLGLSFSLMDQDAMRRRAAALPSDVSPWSVEPLVVASVDYVKRPEVLPSVAAAGWDLVIVDEAHGCCGESDRQQAIATIASRAPFVLLLTATPHNGNEGTFSTLCGLGRLDEELVVFRRTRLEAGRDSGRRVHTVKVKPTRAERRMHRALAELARAVRDERKHLEPHAWLTLTLLHKRALSSPWALAESAERRLAFLERGDPLGTQLVLPWDDPSGELDGADAAPALGNEPLLASRDRERQLLEQVVQAARAAAGADAKLQCLRRMLRRLHEPVIIFTEYRDTLLHLQAQLVPEAVLMHGGMNREQRRAALAAFPAVGILLATDAASEGLNLQEHCRTVINLELPWNPMRLEQRIGRVDRIGQRRRVHVFHLVADGTGETRLLSTLTARVSHAHARVGAPNPLEGRPEWTEDASARLVILRTEAALPASEPMRTPPVRLTRLADEAAAEAARVNLVRTICKARANGAEHSTPRAGVDNSRSVLTTRARRWSTRAALGDGTLRIAQTRVVDDAGRTIATHVSATRAPRGADASADDLTPVTRTSEFACWRTQAVAAHAALTAARRQRALAIAAACTMPAGEQQPGLFDRRTERAWHARTSEQEQMRAAAQARLARIEAGSALHVTEPELVLVLHTTGPEPQR